MINETGRTGITTDGLINIYQTITILNPGLDLKEGGSRFSALQSKTGAIMSRHGHQNEITTINREPREARTKDEQVELTDLAQVIKQKNQTETCSKETRMPPLTNGERRHKEAGKL